MINEVAYSQAAVEVLDIIKHMDESIIEQIPLDFIKKLNDVKSTEYNSNIDFTKPLEENSLKYQTKAILAIMYRDYICSEEEKDQLEKTLSINEEKRKEKYKTNVFQNNHKIKQEFALVQIKAKKNIFQRIFDKIFQ